MFHRHSRDGVTSRLRLRGHDYSEPGTYFLTVCVNERRCLFGDVQDAEMVLNPAGHAVVRRWEEMPTRYPGLAIDALVVMPNHTHALVTILADDDDSAFRPNISTALQWFKSITTVDYTRGVRSDGWPRFRGRLWQEGFYDHLVRDEREEAQLRGYIEANPANWGHDSLRP